MSEGDSSFIILRRIHSELTVNFLMEGEEVAIRRKILNKNKLNFANRHFFPYIPYKHPVIPIKVRNLLLSSTNHLELRNIKTRRSEDCSKII